MKLTRNSWQIIGVILIAPIIAIVIGLDFNRSINKANANKGNDTGGFHKFNRMIIDSTFKGGYQIKSADINADNLPDLIAVSTNMPEIFWYENPSWERHLLYDSTTGNIDLAPKDIDHDGDIDLAIACQFSLNNSISGGHVYWLENEDRGKSWKRHFIDSIPTSHRLRWADLNGDANEELINLPIVGRGATRPLYKSGVEFCYYTVPTDPARELWTKNVIDNDLEMAHGLQLVHWEGEPEWSVLTASFEGVHLYRNQGEGQSVMWNKTQIGSGDVKPRPMQGSSEVGLGRFGKSGSSYVATIEPWHGNQVVFYVPGEKGGLWKREVIDTTFVDGHALICSDLNQDGVDEIIAGHRGPGYNLYIYYWNHLNQVWEREDLDRGGMSAAGLCLLDFNADGYLDIAACGSATNNVVLYENLGK
ncbi:MAG: VCBS repeat-containing protein [Saprospiraceae bacterium]|nr:VCBS repeat-containing protein [Saprospiraceae bacterium]